MGKYVSRSQFWPKTDSVLINWELYNGFDVLATLILAIATHESWVGDKTKWNTPCSNSDQYSVDAVFEDTFCQLLFFWGGGGCGFFYHRYKECDSVQK